MHTEWRRKLSNKIQFKQSIKQSLTDKTTFLERTEDLMNAVTPYIYNIVPPSHCSAFICQIHLN